MDVDITRLAKDHAIRYIDDFSNPSRPLRKSATGSGESEGVERIGRPGDENTRHRDARHVVPERHFVPQVSTERKGGRMKNINAKLNGETKPV